MKQPTKQQAIWIHWGPINHSPVEWEKYEASKPELYDCNKSLEKQLIGMIGIVHVVFADLEQKRYILFFFSVHG